MSEQRSPQQYGNSSDLYGGKGKVFFKRSQDCPLSVDGAPEIDYKNIELLSKYVSERGKMMPRRITSICSKKQRELARAIKRARILALMPFVNK